MHKQIQFSHGVYVTDFRPNGQLKGINTQAEAKIKDVGLMLDKLFNNESRIKQLLYSIEAIKQEEGWETDQVLLEAIEQNYELTLKFSNEMKEYILELTALKYTPETDKIEQLLNPNRITDRQNQIQQQFNEFLSMYGAAAFKEKEEDEKIPIEVTQPTENQAGTNSKQEKQDKGIYV